MRLRTYRFWHDKKRVIEMTAKKTVFDIGQAAFDGNLGVLEEYLGNGGDPNATHSGKPLLALAVLGNHPGAVTRLLKAGADVHATFNGESIISCARVSTDKTVRAVIERALSQESPASSRQAADWMKTFTGQHKAKQALRSVLSVAKTNQFRKTHGLPPIAVNFHAAFLGNPGTGKTTFARHYAEEIKAAGCLETGHLIEVSRADLISHNVGGTALKTRKVVQEAMGGVLFIDEAYALIAGQEDEWGIECINTLTKEIEDNRNRFITIFAGYDHEMRDFLQGNPGLASRVPNIVQFEDFSADELQEIFLNLVAANHYEIGDEEKSYFRREIVARKKKNNFGNAREVRNLFEKIVGQHSTRIATSGLSEPSKADLCRLTLEDVVTGSRDRGLNESELSTFYRSSDRSADTTAPDFLSPEVIRQFDELQHFVDITRARTPEGELSDLAVHLIFNGPRGTGKSSAARYVARMLNRRGFLPFDQVVEIDRTQLVGQYVGHTLRNARQVFERALGGVLLINDIYRLQQSASSFDQEALDVIERMMERFGDKLTVILAGDTDEQENFLVTRPLLASHFNRRVTFPAFTETESLKIFKDRASRRGYRLDPSFETQLKQYFGWIIANKPSTFANLRTVENTLGLVCQNHATRVAAMMSGPLFDRSMIDLICKEDLPADHA